MANGNFLGLKKSSSLSSASGLWNVSEVHQNVLADNWPGFAKEVQYLVLAGGGGGAGSNGSWAGSGGGAGGYRCSVVGEPSGGGSPAEPAILLYGTYPIIVGAGSAGSSAATNALAGFDSTFANIVADGGGGGVGSGSTTNYYNGGSGAGSYGNTTTPGSATANQGFDGGPRTGATRRGSGGGGASSQPASIPGDGFSGNAANGGPGGNGLAITFGTTPRTLAGGGGGGSHGDGVSNAFGGAGGGVGGITVGGNGGGFASNNYYAAGNAVASTGSGGGGGHCRSYTATTQAGANGSGGLVMFSLPQEVSVTFSAGVTHSTEPDGDNTVYIVTATSTTDETVTIG